MPGTTVETPPDAPTIVTDAYASERQRFVFVYYPGREEPQRWRKLEDAVTAIAQEGYERAHLETETWSCQLLITENRGLPREYPVPSLGKLSPRR